jgi:hypothetical protein
MSSEKKTLPDYMTILGWGITELARQARIDYKTARRAYYGETIRGRAARDIAQAITYALGEQVNVGDIEGLHYQ